MTDAFNKDRLYAENESLRERIAELENVSAQRLYDECISHMALCDASEQVVIAARNYLRKLKEQEND